MAVPEPESAVACLSLQLFGPFDLRRGGEPLPRVRTRYGHWLLALLALRHGQEVERGWLAGTLWPESSGPLAYRSLRSCLADLRHCLGADAERLVSPTPHTLRLDLGVAEVDVLAFDAAIARGDPPSLAQAVSLYRGPLLEGCTEEWAFQERQVREQAYLAARERLAALALEQGEASEAERHLRLAVAADPLRESTQRALMQVLAAVGNYAAALLCYRDLRLRLHRELNAEPDPETQTLFQQLRSEARRLSVKGAGPTLRAGAAVRERATFGSLLLPIGATDAAPHSLPLPLTRFIGREREIVEVNRLLASTRLLTVTGAGGCGKTRLALQVAAELLGDSKGPGAGAVRLVELAPLADPKLVPQAAASALAVQEVPGRSITESLVDALRSRSLLIILDNCEHLLGGCVELAEALLRSCPRLYILATSREGLNIPGETTYRLPSLLVPGNAPAPLEALGRIEAVELFLDRARSAAPSFALTESNAPAVAAICRRLDGIPLAIELAAARVRALPVETIHARLAS